MFLIYKIISVSLNNFVLLRRNIKCRDDMIDHGTHDKGSTIKKKMIRLLLLPSTMGTFPICKYNY